MSEIAKEYMVNEQARTVEQFEQLVMPILDLGKYTTAEQTKKVIEEYCTVNGKIQHLGYFNTQQEAFTVYKPFKEDLCKQLALKWQHEIDERLFNAMMKWSI